MEVQQRNNPEDSHLKFEVCSDHPQEINNLKELTFTVLRK
jgi:hypothetical protein